MKFTIKSLLRDKNVLRAVSVISVLNLIGFVMLRNFDAVAFFVVTGFLMTYFSKNMIIVLLVAMLSTNLFISSRLLHPIIKEGMNGTKKKKKEDNKENEDEDDESIENTGKLDAKATQDAAHENLQNIIGGNNIQKMSEDTQKLMSNQNDLHKSLESIIPAVNESMATLEKFGGMDKLTGMIDKLSSITGAFGGKKNE
jgi:ABC-type bacteriocin/lantibiotic exporter with double-glycine peptidase domain